MCVRVCVCVCVSVCPSVTNLAASIRRSCDKMNVPNRSSLNLKVLIKLAISLQSSLPSYSLFLVLHCHTDGHLQLSVLTPVFSESDDHCLKYIMHTDCRMQH